MPSSRFQRRALALVAMLAVVACAAWSCKKEPVVLTPGQVYVQQLAEWRQDVAHIGLANHIRAERGWPLLDLPPKPQPPPEGP